MARHHDVRPRLCCSRRLGAWSRQSARGEGESEGAGSYSPRRAPRRRSWTNRDFGIPQRWPSLEAWRQHQGVVAPPHSDVVSERGQRGSGLGRICRAGTRGRRPGSPSAMGAPGSSRGQG
ncbi:hornerin-like [Iris pallida]|uniref:Hornerin-like n=1 Tax=Iris pallida TaxID=29817 RepID=A0AAX6GA14_IRIPA|nr:hornerin-like [Iris pallida]